MSSRHIVRIEGERVALTILKPDKETEEKLLGWMADESIRLNNYLDVKRMTYANIEDWIQEKGTSRLGIVLRKTDG